METPASGAQITEVETVSKDSAAESLDPGLLNAQDLLSFDMLDIRDRHTPRVSQTATPNNTPQGKEDNRQ